LVVNVNVKVNGSWWKGTGERGVRRWEMEDRRWGAFRGLGVRDGGKRFKV